MPAETSGKPSVLLVEDEAALLATMIEALKAEFTVDGVGAAEDAGKLATTRKYDVIVSDQLLPKEQGLEFLIRVGGIQPSARRILLTGYINPELLTRSVKLAGLSACLLKPVSGADLVKAIKKALGS